VPAPRVSLFITCLNDTLFPQTGRAVVTLLERLGVAVDFPLEQTCCGQMHLNTGYAREAIPLVRRFVSVFGDAEVVVSPSASCVGMVRDAFPRLARRSGDESLVAAVDGLVPRVLELTELLVDRLGVRDVGAQFPHRVAYHPTCHSLRALQLGERPLQLLRAVGGIDLVPLADAEQCCGFGGTFAVKNADTSVAMLSDKMRAVLDTGAEVIAAADNSCLMQIGGGLQRQRAGVRAMHVAEILACDGSDGSDGSGGSGGSDGSEGGR
jgi:L-lactate dehydrogenase complex protein LldE